MPRPQLALALAAAVALATVGAALVEPRLPVGTADAPPVWPVTYQANRSAYLYWCDWSAPLDPASVANWSIVSLDWSNQKWGPSGWAATSPMDCEERLQSDAIAIVAGSRSPSTARAWVYRNTCKALPWFTTVRAKLVDPSYAPWFLRYGAVPPINATSYFSPPCDPNFDPPLCSALYHDSTQSPDYKKIPTCAIDGDCSVQVPGFPFGDGNCSAPACDVGAVPVGEYVFDPRAWNTSVNGQTLGQWWLETYLFGPTGAGNQNITGFYFDDSMSPLCSELDSNQEADLGVSAAEKQAIGDAYASNFVQLYAELTARGAYTEQQFTSVSAPSNKNDCESLFARLCQPPPAAPASLLVQMDDSNALLSFAVYLLGRQEYGYFGRSWRGGCAQRTQPMPPPGPPVIWHSDLYDADYGEPLELCHASTGDAAVFERAWSRANVSMNCSAPGFAPRITWA